MTSALQYVHALITRDAAQTYALQDAMVRQGGAVSSVATMRIVPTTYRIAWARTLLTHVQSILFSSVHAVRCSAALYAQMRRVPTIGAVGLATRQALLQVGLQQIVVPSEGYGSDALLAHPAWQHPRGQHLLITGYDGLTHFQPMLAERGASALVLRVYQRFAIPIDITCLAPWFAARKPVLVGYSVAMIQSLLQALPLPLQDNLRTVPTVVVSARMQHALHAQGFLCVSVADSLEDTAVLSAVRAAMA